MRHRYYNTDIRRFVNQDIVKGNIGNSQSLNRYVRGNPLTYTDSFGLSLEKDGESIGMNVAEMATSGKGIVESRNRLGKMVKEGGTTNKMSKGISKSGSKAVNPKDVNFMQSSIKNQTGEHTVLGNAEALKSGALKATDLPEIRIWQDADGKLWTLDHRRLAAFRMAELDSVPFRWATDEEVAKQMWKMTTKTNGTSIKSKLGDEQSMTIQ